MARDRDSDVLRYVEQLNVPVFPCEREGKRPLTPHGHKDASRDPAQIREWLRKYPRCNWAIPTGAASGFVVFDEDIRPEKDRRGDLALRDLESKHGPLPRTKAIKTPSGGLHLYFRANGTPIPSSVDRVGRGLDVRGEGGYVLIPPSSIGKVAYVVEDDAPAAELPRWLQEKMLDPKVESHAGAGADRAIREGSRNAVLASLAGSMRARGMSREAIQAALIAENASRCDPPLDAAEVRRIAGSVSKYDPEASDFPQPLDLSRLAAMDPSPPISVMEGLPVGYATGCFGHGGIGKSQIELLRAVCIASGSEFCGLPVQRKRVGFLSCEDRIDVLHWRLTRICRYLCISLSDLSDSLFVLDMVGRESVLFSADARGAGVTATYAALAEFVSQRNIEALFVDGIADTFGGNENARSDVKRFVNALLGLIPPERGAVVLIGHVDKASARAVATSEGYSGSTAWHNSVRARWYLYPQVEQEEDRRTGRLLLELQKSNHSAFGVQIEFQWDDKAHLFVGTAIPSATPSERAQRDAAERKAILLALRECAAANNVVPAAATGRRTAFHVLSMASAFPASLKTGKMGLRRFWSHVEHLRHSRDITETAYKRPDGHRGIQLKVSDEF